VVAVDAESLVIQEAQKKRGCDHILTLGQADGDPVYLQRRMAADPMSLLSSESSWAWAAAPYFAVPAGYAWPAGAVSAHWRLESHITYLAEAEDMQGAVRLVQEEGYSVTTAATVQKNVKKNVVPRIIQHDWLHY
jgi:hypothetical protein